MYFKHFLLLHIDKIPTVTKYINGKNTAFALFILGYSIKSIHDMTLINQIIIIISMLIFLLLISFIAFSIQLNIPKTKNGIDI